MAETTVKLENEEILAVWGSKGDSMVYEGCHGLLSDGRIYVCIGSHCRKSKDGWKLSW